MLKEQLERLATPVIVELDASTLSNEEIYSRWAQAKDRHTPFVIAINAAVLFSVYKSYPDFRPIKEAYFQMANAVVFHDEDANTDSCSYLT